MAVVEGRAALRRAVLLLLCHGCQATFTLVTSVSRPTAVAPEVCFVGNNMLRPNGRGVDVFDVTDIRLLVAPGATVSFASAVDKDLNLISSWGSRVVVASDTVSDPREIFILTDTTETTRIALPGSQAASSVTLVESGGQSVMLVETESSMRRWVLPAALCNTANCLPADTPIDGLASTFSGGIQRDGPTGKVVTILGNKGVAYTSLEGTPVKTDLNFGAQTVCAMNSRIYGAVFGDLKEYNTGGADLGNTQTAGMGYAGSIRCCTATNEIATWGTTGLKVYKVDPGVSYTEQLSLDVVVGDVEFWQGHIIVPTAAGVDVYGIDTPAPPTPAPPTPAPPTPAPPTPAPDTPSPPTPAPPTPAPPTPAPDTPAPPTPAPDTPAPPTPVPPTPAPPTFAPPTPAPPTPAPPTLAPPTPAPDTPAPPTPAPPTLAPPTPAPDTPSPPTPAPPTPAPSTPAPDTPAPPTPAPPTPVPDTPAPQTPAPDTSAPPTPAPPTPAPQTPAPDTPAPTSAPPTPAPPTPAPATPAPDTPAPPTPAPDTPAPQTPAPATPAPPTPAPDTPAPTPAPPTPAPDTPVPFTPVPPTSTPPTPAPDTLAPPTPEPIPTLAPPTLTPTRVPFTFPPGPDVSGNETNLPSIAAPITEPPRVRMQVVGASLKARQTASSAADTAGTAVAAVAMLGGASGSSAPGQMMIIGGISCIDTDDSDDLELLIHPLGFRIDGVPAAGAVVGNVLLSCAACVLLTALVRLLAFCGVGTTKAGRNRSPVERAAGTLRYPSVLAPIPLLLLPGTFQSALDIVLYPRDSLLVSLIGWTGCIFVLFGVAVWTYRSSPPHAETAPVEAGRAMRYLLGSSEWVSSDRQPLYVERYGVIFDIYRQLPWVRGRYFLLELLPIFPMAAVATLRSTDETVCAAKCAMLAAIIMVWTLVIVGGRVFIAPVVTHMMIAGNTLMLLGLLGHAASYAQGRDAQHWGIKGGMFMFAGSLMVSVGRAVYDFATLCIDLYSRFTDKADKADKSGDLTLLHYPADGEELHPLPLSHGDI